jgi:hypothetical protein
MIENQYFSNAERHLGNAERHLGNAERILALQNWHISNANQHLIIENQHLIINQYNFVHNLHRRVPSIISFTSLEFCLILLMTLGISSEIVVLKVGPISPPKKIMVPNGGPISGSQTCGPKSWSQIRVPNWGPKSGSQIGVPNGGVPNRGPKSGSKMGVQNQGPKPGFQIGVLNRGPQIVRGIVSALHIAMWCSILRKWNTKVWVPE